MLKIFTIKFEESIESFNDSMLYNFLGDKELVSWDAQFFQRKDAYFWTVMVEYRQAGHTSREHKIGKGKKDDSYKDILTEKDWPLFKVLKEWRGETSKKEGVPPYIICTNRQLAEVAVKRPASLNALHDINGIGEAKIRKYGRALIGLVSSHGIAVSTYSEARNV